MVYASAGAFDDKDWLIFLQKAFVTVPAVCWILVFPHAREVEPR
jgi:hypothetical protein